MLKQIKVGQTTLAVQELYPYRHDFGKGREVLRLKISRESHNYADIEGVLEHPVGDITYLEDGQEVNVYKGYNRDFTCTYSNNTYEVEITRVSPLELKVEALEAKVAELEAQNA